MDHFLQVLNMSLGASAAIGIVLILRLLLRRMPGKIAYLLWGVVLFRLLCPWTLELPRTVMPQRQVLPETALIEQREEISLRSSADAALRAVGDTLNGGIDPVYVRVDRAEAEPQTETTVAVSAEHGQVWLLLLGKLWPIGMLAMGGCSLYSWAKLRRRLVGAVSVGEQVWMADHIDSPFVWGLLRPRIYLPSDLEGEEREYIILHERTHIARLDHLTRPLAWLALCIHWFNPLVWLAFYLSGKDMEMACDEAVVDKLGSEIRKDYCTSLVRFAEGPRLPGITFSEGNVEGRVKNLLRYKKPALWLTVIAALLVLLLGLFMVTSGKHAVQDAELFREGIETAITDARAGHWGNMVQEHYGAGIITERMIDDMAETEILPADSLYDWELFEYQAQLSWGERTCRFGWSPAMPDRVYGQWIEGGSYTQPVWIRSREVALGVIYGITRWDSDCGNTMHFRKVENGRMIKDYTFDDYIAMNALALALAECTPTDRAPICGDGKLPETIDYYTIDIEGHHGTAQHAYAFCIYPDESYETWYVEVPGERVYAVTDSIRWMLEGDLNVYDSFLHAPTLTIRSGEDTITVDPVLPARLGESFLWIQTLESVPNEHGIPFAAYDEDGAKIDDMRMQVRIQSQGRAETTISDSLSRYHGSLGKLYPALEKGETYSVDLTLTLGGNKTNASYRFNIIPQ